MLDAEPAHSFKPYSTFELSLDSKTNPVDWDDLLFWTLMLVWPTGVGLVLLRTTIASMRFWRRLRKCESVIAPEIVDVVLHACDQLGVRRPPIKLVPGLSAPALFGFLRPTLCLPEAHSLSAVELRLIALHEAAHLKRRDALVACLLTPVRTLHWFNPLAWFTLGRIERYREQACDEAVLRAADPTDRNAYAELMVRFASERPEPAIGLVGLGFTRPVKELSRRVSEIQEAAPPRSRWGITVSLAVVLAVALVGLTNASAPAPVQPHEQPKPKQYAWNLTEQASKPAEHAIKAELRQYDLAPAVSRVREVHPEKQEPRKRVLQFLLLNGGKHRDLPDEDGSADRIAVRATAEGHQFFLQRAGRHGQVRPRLAGRRIGAGDPIQQLRRDSGDRLAKRRAI